MTNIKYIRLSVYKITVDNPPTEDLNKVLPDWVCNYIGTPKESMRVRYLLIR